LSNERFINDATPKAIGYFRSSPPYKKTRSA